MRIHYTKNQLLVLLGAALYQCAFLGILINSGSVLLGQIRDDLGFSLTRISVYHTLKNITGAVGSAAIITLFFRCSKPLFMSVNILFVVGSYSLLVIGADTVLWYFAAIMLGVSYCTASIYVPTILAPWFPSGIGTATGFAMAFSGIGGVVFNPFASYLLAQFGWKCTIGILCAITVILSCVGLYLIFCSSAPNVTKGKSPEPPVEKTCTASFGGMHKHFPLCCVAFLGGSLVLQFMQYISPYAQSIGYSLQTGASMSATLMAGNVIGKIFFGVCCDLIGVWKTMIATLSSIILASVCLIVFTKVLPILFIASFLYGLVAALATISVARCCTAVYGITYIGKYMGLHTSVSCMTGAVFSMVIGLFYDSWGSYVPFLCISILVSIISIAAIAKLDALCK